MFLSPWFLGGLVLAAGPLVIHLLNRQRYRVIEWAAMDFLRQAVRRSRRILQLRDLLLLALRTLCIAAFCLAMARPLLRTASVAVDPDAPVHAILILDNSLSMGYQRLSGTLLDEAKAKAKEYIERLPSGSRFSIVPLCGSAAPVSRDAYSTKEDAVEALAAIEPVDRSGSAAAAVDLAVEASARVTTPSAKQVVFFSDQQSCNWPADSLEANLAKLPAPIQIVQIPLNDPENAWVEDFRLQDGIADLSTPAVFLATIRYEGPFPRRDVQVTLAVDGATVATQEIELQPGQVREVRFPPYQIDATVEPGRAAFVAAEVSIPHDRLPEDDQRVLAVPVVAAVPVVFVDQLGSDENPQQSLYGETFRLRRLLAPVLSHEESKRPLVEVRHLKIGRLDRSQLEDARLVVIAGVADPVDSVPLLREYVEQGGKLVIAAGGRFDPVAWTDAGWRGGLGILPAPLEPEPVGRVPGESSGPLEPFQLDPAGMVHDYFLLEQTSREELEDLYRQPYFFKAVVADVSEEVREEVLRNVAEQIKADRAAIEKIDRRLAELSRSQARGTAGRDDRDEIARLERERAEIVPEWLLRDDARRDGEDDSLSARELAEHSSPEVLARFTNGVPFMIRRRIGRGRVLFVSTGVYRDWNTLTTSNAVLVFDRIFRRLLLDTLPVRNVSSTGQLVVPLAAADRRARFELTDPEGCVAPLAVDMLPGERYAVTADNLCRRGRYVLTAYGTEATPQAGPEAKLWEIPLAVNGPAAESELAAIDDASLAERMGGADYQWIAHGQTINVLGVEVQGWDLWKWIMAAALLCLFVELLILAWPSLTRERNG